jgi:hypothetical protein
MVLHRFFEPSENLAGGEEYTKLAAYYSAGPVIGPPGAVAPWEGGSITGHAIAVPPRWGWVEHMQ